MQRSACALPPLRRQLSHTRAFRSCSLLPVAVLPAPASRSPHQLAAASRRAAATRLSAATHSTRRSFATDANRTATGESDSRDPFQLPRAFLVNTATIPGYEVSAVIGLVSGNTVRVRNIVRDYFAGLRSIFGGELTTYTDLMMEAREEATERMVNEAVELGANAIVNIRVETSALAANSSEMYCYGTAVVVRLAESADRQSRQPNDGSVQPSVNE